MAGRIRSIKPELLEDEIAAGLSDAAWRLFVSSWVLADDHGCFRAGGAYLAAQVWHDTRRDALTPLLELADRGRVLLYEVDGQAYAIVAKWERHQRVDNAGKRRVPPPPTNIQEVSVRFAEFLRGVLRCPKTLPLDPDHRSPITTTDHKARGGFENPSPSGAGPFLPVDPESPDEPSMDLLASDSVDPREAACDPSAQMPDAAPEPPRQGPTSPADPSGDAQPSARPALTPPEPPAGPQPADHASVAAHKATMSASAAPGQLAMLFALEPAKRNYDPVEAIFADYLIGWKRVIHGRRAPKLDEKRRRLTLARLRDFTEDDLKAAARGVFASEWNVENRQTDYDLVMRDTKHVEKFMACDEAARASEAPRTPEWLAEATRPSARVTRALREQKGTPPSGSGSAVDFRAMLDDVGSIDEVIDE
jgi:hypothetical protein